MRIIVPTPSTSSGTDSRASGSYTSTGQSGRGTMANKDLQCKVKYIKGDGHEDEIRRFKLEKQGSSSFAQLKMKIAAIFPDLQYRNFKIYWVDEHKETISFGTDMELAAALDSARNGLLNVIVKVEPGMPNQNMFGMGGFPGMQPPVQGFGPNPAQAFSGQPNMFYNAGMMPPAMNPGSFGFTQPPPVPPTNSYSWASSDVNGSSQAQFQSQTQAPPPPKPSPPPPQPKPKPTAAPPAPNNNSPKDPPTPQKQNIQRIVKDTPAPEEPKDDLGVDLRSSIHRNREKLQLLMQAKRKDAM